MKLKYIFMSMVMAVAAMVGFTSCSDDDNDAPAPADKTDLVLSNDTRVKIGTENRVLLPIQSGNGDYRAFSLAPEIADVIEENNQYYIEGYKNGTARIVVSDGANNYKQMLVSVYTTDNMTLSHENLTFVTPLGFSSTNTEVKVAEGNGGYTIESDNDKVEPSIDEETGEISLKATSGADPYVATVTVHDCSSLSASFSVSVEATFDPFTQSDLDDLLASTEDECYIFSNLFPERVNAELSYNAWYYGQWADFDGSDGLHTFGWWDISYGSDYGGHYILYPNNAQVNQEVNGTYQFKYNASWSSNYPKWELDGKAKILKDDETSKVVIWWNVDLDNECINRGWIIKMK